MATKYQSLEEVLGDTPPGKLDQPCQERHLRLIASVMNNWEDVSPFLKLKSSEETEIKRDWPHYRRQKLEILKRWKAKCQQKNRACSYRSLCKAFWEAGVITLINKVCDILCGQESSSSDEDEEESASPAPFPKKLKLSHVPLSTSGQRTDSCSPAQRHDSKSVMDAFLKDIPSKLLDQPCSNDHLHKMSHTYCEASLQAPMLNVIEKVCDVFCMKVYANHLRKIFFSHTPKFTANQWPIPFQFPSTLDLAMYSAECIQRVLPSQQTVRFLLSGEIQEVLNGQNLATVDSLFRKLPEVILIEGALGTGKSTLARHVYHSWIAGNFSEEFQIVIYVELCDPDVWLSKSLVDLLPPHSTKEDVVAEIENSLGRGLLIVIDGWDEFEPGFQEASFLKNLVCDRQKFRLDHSTILITSRPCVSYQLQPYVQSRFVLLGFRPGQEKHFFEIALKDPEAVQKLQQLEDCPTIASLCSLPLFAAMVTQVFMEKGHILPVTLYEVQVLSAVVCGCVTRHLMKLKHKDHAVLSLDHLLGDRVFRSICALAHRGSLENRITFALQDLTSCELSDERDILGLMRVHTINSYSKESGTEYYFLHHSIQNLLTALHISQLAPPEQLDSFKRIDSHSAIFSLFVQTAHTRKVPLQKLICYLHETKDVLLCCRVASELNGKLVLCDVVLNSSDCLSVGYFLSCACTNQSRNFNVDLTNCSLNDNSITCLLQGLSSGSDQLHGQLTLKLCRNEIHQDCSYLTKKGFVIET